MVALLDMANRPSAQTYWRARANALQQLGLLLAPAEPHQAARLDEATTAALLPLARAAQAWVRTGALRVLGQSRDPLHAELYIASLSDSSDRVVNAAAIALGRSASPKAFAALLALPAKPSWKNQSLISALNGLKELGDPRGVDLATQAISDLNSARWTLATPVWDFRLAAADTLVALGGAPAVVPMLLERFDKALAEGDVNDQFSNLLLLVTLGDPRTERALAALKQRYADDPNAMQAITGYEQQLADKRKPR